MEQYEFNQDAQSMTTLPHVSDAERSVLGSMLIDGGALEVSLEQLHEEDFYVPANATIFAAMRDVRAGGNAVDLVTLTAELERHNKLEMAGGLAYLTDLVTFVPTAANVSHYINLVETKSTQRALIRAGSEIMRDTRFRSIGDVIWVTYTIAQMLIVYSSSSALQLLAQMQRT